MRKRLLLIHNHNWDIYAGNKAAFVKGVTSLVRMATEFHNTTYIRDWHEVSVEECNNYDYVMMIILPEQNTDKLGKYLSIILNPDRTYKTICYLPDVVGWQMNPFLPENKIKYMDMLYYADFTMRFNLPSSESYWKAVLRGKKSYMLERHYPVEWIDIMRNESNPAADKVIAENNLDKNSQYILIDNGVKNINEERNTLCSMYVSRKIQELTGWKLVCFTSHLLDRNVKDETYKSISGLENVTELPIQDWSTYMKILMSLDIRIAIHLDCLETRGQVPIDCACLGLPLICSGSVAGATLYPHTFLENCRDIDTATKLAYEVISNEKFRNKVIDFATNKKWWYSLGEVTQRFNKIIGEAL